MPLSALKVFLIWSSALSIYFRILSIFQMEWGVEVVGHENAKNKGVMKDYFSIDLNQQI